MPVRTRVGKFQAEVRLAVILVSMFQTEVEGLWPGHGLSERPHAGAAAGILDTSLEQRDDFAQDLTDYGVWDGLDLPAGSGAQIKRARLIASNDAYRLRSSRRERDREAGSPCEAAAG